MCSWVTKQWKTDPSSLDIRQNGLRQGSLENDNKFRFLYGFEMKGGIPRPPPTTKINVRTPVMPDEKGQQQCGTPLIERQIGGVASK